MNEQRPWLLIFSCWIIAAISMGGSLFFSDVMEFPPCSMCWYQRIAMYPLVFIFLAGLFPLDRNVLRFSTPLVIVGWLLALWHNLLHWEIVPETATPCREGVSCSTVYIDWGIITIPLLSLIAFSMIGVLLFIYSRSLQDKS
jgi:disulfide bond formation protein DsbB